MRKGIRIGSVLRRVALATALALAPAAAQDDWSEFDDFEEEFEEFEEEADEPEANQEPAPPPSEGEGSGDPFAQTPPDVPGAPEGDEAGAPGEGEGEEEEPREIDVGGIPVEIAPRAGENDEPEVAEDEEPDGVEVPVGGVWDHDESHGFDERGGDRIRTHGIGK